MSDLISLILLFFTVMRREGISQSVVTDVIKIFRGKTVKELETLQKQIETKINSGEEGIDIGYWESLLSQLKGKVKYFPHFILTKSVL